MNHYVCTVEFRDCDSGTMHHFVRKLRAPDGEAASAAAQRHFLEEHGRGEAALEVAEIVCMPEEHH